LVESFSQPTIGSVGNLPRNVGRGPNSYTLNLRLSREFRFSENRKTELLVEAFNPFNSTVFSFGAEFVDFTPSAWAIPRPATDIETAHDASGIKVRVLEEFAIACEGRQWIRYREHERPAASQRNISTDTGRLRSGTVSEAAAQLSVHAFARRYLS
jgi:hypothetical protein